MGTCIVTFGPCCTSCTTILSFLQADSPQWKNLRRLLFTASEAHTILSLTSESAKMNFLRRYLWNIKPFKGNKATEYGKEKEPIARRCYELYNQLFVDRTGRVVTTGLMISKRFFVLGCSPDGIVESDVKPPKLVEIKCPYLLRDVHPRRFKEVLTKEQLKTFPLKRFTGGRIHLKVHHKHYYQVQMQMDIMKMTECDYVVWSELGILVINVPYDPEFWRPRRMELLRIYEELFAPEFWLMRTPRGLLPITLRITRQDSEEECSP